MVLPDDSSAPVLAPGPSPVDPSELVAVPSSGRRFTTRRRVRLGDASPAGRLRLDALARYLQDVAEDDSRDAGAGALRWVVRRTTIRVVTPAFLGDEVELTTWCSGVGRRWAERRTQIRSAAGAVLDAASLWVLVDERGRPAVLPDGFDDGWGAAALGRTVGSRLRLADLPASLAAGATAGGTGRWSWPLRFGDFDALGHVNNAVFWGVVEDARSRLERWPAPLVVEIEHRAPLTTGPLEVVAATAPARPTAGEPPGPGWSGSWLWMVAEGRTVAVALVRPVAGRTG